MMHSFALTRSLLERLAVDFLNYIGSIKRKPISLDRCWWSCQHQKARRVRDISTLRAQNRQGLALQTNFENTTPSPRPAIQPLANSGRLWPVSPAQILTLHLDRSNRNLATARFCSRFVPLLICLERPVEIRLLAVAQH